MGTLALKTTAFLCAVVVVFGAAGLVAYILRMRRYRNTTLLLAAASDALADVQLTVGERGEAVVSNRAFRELIVETDAGGPALNQLRAWLCVTPESAAAFDLPRRGAAARKAGRVAIRRIGPGGRAGTERRRGGEEGVRTG